MLHRIKFPLLVKQQAAKISCQRCGNTVEIEEVTANTLIARFLEPLEGQGHTIAEMEILMSIANKIRIGHGHVDLETPEWKKLMVGVAGIKWLRNDEDVLACGLAIRDAEELEVEVKEKPKEEKKE